MRFLIFAALSISAHAITHLHDVGKFKECHPEINKGKLLSLDVYPCGKTNSEHRCQLISNETVNIHINFTSNVNTTKVKTIVHGIGFGSILEALIKIATHDTEDGIRFLDIAENACVHPDVDHCNITSGETLSYSNSLFIQPLYPEKRLDIRFELRDDNNQDLVCVQFAAAILHTPK